MVKRLLVLSFLILFLLGVFAYGNFANNKITSEKSASKSTDSEGGPKIDVHPLSIQALRNGEYPGSDIVIEQTLDPGVNYQRYIASYKSDGLKIYGLLTIPSGEKPENGWPVIIFNHGYIPPSEYRTTERYIAYTDAFSRNGYILFRPDYRGHGNSEGNPAGGYGSNAYTIDVLNAVSSVKRLQLPENLTPALSLTTILSQGERKTIDPSPERRGEGEVLEMENIVDENNIGMWGHSMGGHITLRSMVVNKDIKAGVIWAGVVASYPDLISNWRRNPPRPTLPGNRRGWRGDLTIQFGSPEENPTFWNSISSNSYLSDISGPLQLHHGTSDHSVPHEFSETLAKHMEEAGKEVELYIYPGDEHDIPVNFGIAMQRSVEFFDRYLK